MLTHHGGENVPLMESKCLAFSEACSSEPSNGAGDVGWTYAAEIAGCDEPAIIKMLGWAGPYDQYHASNAQPHFITEMMVNTAEPFHAERLLLSTGITNHYMESNWKETEFSAVGRVVATPCLDIRYHSTRPAQFSTGERPPPCPYIRGFADP